MNMLIITLVLTPDSAKELPDSEERDVKKVVLVNTLN
jgi:hypothetical protein